MEEILAVRELTKTFPPSGKRGRSGPGKTAVDHLSFTACAGEIFGLLGPNGAGKTTTMRMLATLIRPTGGDAVIDGASVVTQSDRVRGKIGFLTGELRLDDCFTPDYLFDFFSGLYCIDPAVSRRRKGELFERFGIASFSQVRVAELSMGMRQKVSLVISIVHDPALVIFDEPTNGLDVITARTVTDFLLELKGRGKSVIVSTHIFSLIEKVCDRVGILLNGRLAACDTLARMTREQCLEDVFFSLYDRGAGTESGVRT